jgi:hypothetical protein
LALSLVACDQGRVASPTVVPQASVGEQASSMRVQAPPPGSGLVLESLTGITLPLVGSLGDIVVDQVVLTNFTLIENTVGQIIGLEVTGTIEGVLTATGVQISEDFTSSVMVTSSGPGQCNLVTVDLGPLNIDALGLVTVDVPEASLTGKGSGAVGSLLCNLGNLLGGLLGGAIPGVGGIVNGINNLI